MKIFEIKQSDVSGRGLFATKLIKKGQQILEFKGPIISYKETIKKLPNKLSCPLQIGLNQYIDLCAPGVLVNHSCLPNAGVKNDRFLIAIEDIAPGQEIFYDYSTTMDDNSWTLKCKCGNRNCRRIIKDFRYLPLSTKERYLGLGIVQSFIKKKLV